MSSSISNPEAASRPTRVAGSARTSRACRFFVAFALTAVILIGGGWWFTAHFQDGFFDPEYGMWTAKEEMVASCDLGSTLVLGDSRAVAGFVPAELGDTVNLALGGASPVEMYFMVERALRCPVPPRRVIVSFSPPQLIADRYYWPRTALFGFLDDRELNDVLRTSRAVGDTDLYSAANLGDLDALLTNWLYAHHFPSYAISSVIERRGLGGLAKNRAFHADTLRERGHHLYGLNSGADAPAEEAFLTGFKASTLMDAYMRRLIAALAARGAAVLYVPAPLNEATRSRMDPKVVGEIGAYLQGLQAQFANFRLIGPSVPGYPDRMFGDWAHLDAAGSRQFSAEVAAHLKSLGYDLAKAPPTTGG